MVGVERVRDWARDWRVGDQVPRRAGNADRARSSNSNSHDGSLA